MWKHLSNFQKASLFTTLVFIFVFLIIVLPIKLGTSFVMFIPLASVLITMLLTSEAFTKSGWKQLGLHRFPVKFILFATFIPMIPILIGYVIVWLTGFGTFKLAKEYEGREVFLFVGFFITFVTSSLTVTLWEEIGWRGYLAAQLKKAGLVKALLLNGFIWSFFHLPIIIFTDIYHSNVNVFLFIPMFIVTVTLAGVFMTYVRYVSGSIWPSILAHTAHNLVWNYGELFTQNPNPIVSYITGDAGVVLIIFYLIIFIWIIKKKNRQELL